MTNTSKNVGTAAETAVVRYLNKNGFPTAERRALAGQYDLGDITGIPGLVIEVKAGAAAKTASDGQVEKWLGETETERVNAKADIGVLVMARAGYGSTRVGQWWAILPGATFIALVHPHHGLDLTGTAPVRIHFESIVNILRFTGYGEPL